MKLPTFCQRPIAPLELQLQLPRFLHTAWAITNDPLVVSKLSLAARSSPFWCCWRAQFVPAVSAVRHPFSACACACTCSWLQLNVNTSASCLLAGALLIIGTVFLSNVQHFAPAADTAPAVFVQVRPGLYRLNFAWKLPGLAPFPVAVWLVECSPNSWILIDAGTSSAGNQQAILQGLNTTLSTQDTLRLILGQTSAIAAALAI